MLLDNLRSLKKYLLVTLIAGSIPLCAVDQTKAALLNVHNDHGYWLEENILYTLPCNFKDFSIDFHAEQRWGADYDLFWFYELETFLQYDVTGWINDWFCICPGSTFFKKLTIAPFGYDYIRQIQKNTLGVFKWAQINKYEIQSYLTLTWSGWDFVQRFRGEYQDYQTKHYKKYGDFRYLIALYTPKIECWWNLQAWIRNEFFFRNNTFHPDTHPLGLVGGWYENRFRTGFSGSIWGDYLTASVWWQWRFLKQKPSVVPHVPTRFDTYQWGTTINLKF